ncbi:MAG: hypothetical protein AAGB03_05620 [Pseudomonadota bacterium]
MVKRLVVSAALATALGAVSFAAPLKAEELYKGNVRVTKVAAKIEDGRFQVDINQDLLFDCNRSLYLASGPGSEDVKKIVVAALLADRPIGISYSTDRIGPFCTLMFVDMI